MWWVRGRHRYVAGKNILISKNDLCFLWTFLLLNVVYYKATYLLLPWGKLGWHKFPYSKCDKWREKKLDFYLFIFNWRIIALQYCAGFCHTSACIDHKYTFVPSLWTSLQPPTPSNLSRLSNPSLNSLTHTANSH